MKNLSYFILLTLAMLAQRTSIAQCDMPTNNVGDYEFKEIVNLDSNYTKNDIYNSALISMSSIFKNADDVIEVKNMEEGYIICKFQLTTTPFRLGNCKSYFRFMLRMDFKDYRYRMLITYLEHKVISSSDGGSCSCPNPISNDKCGSGGCLYKYEWEDQRCEAHLHVCQVVKDLKSLIQQNLNTTGW